MAGLPYIPLDADFPTSRKAVALGIVLQNPLAWAHAVRLWAWCSRNALEGQVVSPTAVRELELGAGWNGREGALVEAMCLPHVRLLDEVPGGFRVHDWDEHCGAHIKKAEKDRQRMRDARAANGSRTVRERGPNKSRTVAPRRDETRGDEKKTIEAAGSASFAAFRAQVAGLLGLDALQLRTAGKGKPVADVVASITADVERLGLPKALEVAGEAIAAAGTGGVGSLSYFVGWLRQAGGVPGPTVGGPEPKDPPTRQLEPGEPLVYKREIGPSGGEIEYHA